MQELQDASEKLSRWYNLTQKMTNNCITEELVERIELRREIVKALAAYEYFKRIQSE